MDKEHHNLLCMQNWDLLKEVFGGMKFRSDNGQ